MQTASKQTATWEIHDHEVINMQYASNLHATTSMATTRKPHFGTEP